MSCRVQRSIISEGRQRERGTERKTHGARADGNWGCDSGAVTTDQGKEETNGSH